MDNKQLMELAKQVKAAEMQKQENERLAQAERIAEYQKELDKWNPKILEWKANINSMIQLGYIFLDELDFRNAHLPSDPNKRKELEVCTLGTDGVYHTFGIYSHFDIIRGIMPSDCGDFGIAQGGANGSWYIHTDGEKWWIQCSGTKQPLREQDYIDIFREMSNGKNRLEIFEDKMNNLYSWLKKKAAA
jgi:hypothetical protein